MDYLGVLKKLHEIRKPDIYLEIGVKHGVSLVLSTGKTIGVDPEMAASLETSTNRRWMKLYRMTSDDFFHQRDAQSTLEGGRLELAFIDGLHIFEQVVRDFINVERWSSPNSMIVIHDVIPPTLQSTVRTPLSGAWVGDVWKIVPCLRQFRPDLNIDVIDAPPSGLLVIYNPDPTNTTLITNFEAIVESFVQNDTDPQCSASSYLSELTATSSSDFIQRIQQEGESWTSIAGDGSSPSLYLELLKNCLTRYVFDQGAASFDPEARSEGRDWPATAETMIGLRRLDNIEACINDVLQMGVPGDVIETGVWRGGATIFMRAVLKANNVRDRSVWVADSFEGLPKPDPTLFPADAGDRHHEKGFLAVSVDEVKANFAKYGLLDEQVQFLVGWFRDTLPAAPIDKIAVLRLDGDMYESTMVALQALYPKVSRGGYVIIDDYALGRCRQAVHDFRTANGVQATLERIDWTGVYWQKLD